MRTHPTVCFFYDGYLHTNPSERYYSIEYLFAVLLYCPVDGDLRFNIFIRTNPTVTFVAIILFYYILRRVLRLSKCMITRQVYASGSGIERGWAALIALVAFSVVSCGVRYARDDRCRICGHHLIWFRNVSLYIGSAQQ